MSSLAACASAPLYRAAPARPPSRRRLTRWQTRAWMDAHLCLEDGASCWRDTPWWRMRAFETQAEMLERVKTAHPRAARLTPDQGPAVIVRCSGESWPRCCATAGKLEARALACQADESARWSPRWVKRSRITPGADFAAVRVLPADALPPARRRTNDFARFSTRSAHLWKTP